MDADALHHLAPDRKHRVQGRQRILKNHRELIATNLIQLLFRHRKQLLAVKQHRSVNDRAPTAQKPHNGQRGHALSTAGLSDNADDLALIHMKAHMIYADGRPVIARERGRQVFYFK